MSDLLLDPVVNKLPISAEARGLARDFCHRVGQEAKLLNKQAIGEPLRRRIARYPDRPPRDDILYDLERAWRDVEPQQFRLDFRSIRKGRDFYVMERAVTIMDGFRLQHWDSNDYGVTVMDTWMDVRRGRARAGVRSRMWIGSHAIARWYQRSGARSDERLLRDIGFGAAIDPYDRTTYPDLDDVRVPTNGFEGWRGAIMLSPEDEGDNLVFHARTFV
jgi:hypothetical protein